MSTIANPVVPACVTRDNLTSPYWPNLSRRGLAWIVALGLVFLLTSFHRLNHTDLWCHVNFGRWMVTHGALPATDPLAGNPSDIVILNSAWLSQVIGYEVQRLFGNEGLVLGHALLVTATAAVLMLAVARRGVPALWSAGAGLAMFVLDLPIVGTIRPQLFGQLGAALFLLACSEMKRGKSPLIWLPMVASLWANLHGSILMGIAILGIHAVGASWEVYHAAAGKFDAIIRDRRLHVAWGAVLIVLLAACANPHGPALLIGIAGFGGNPILESISEWRMLTPSSLTGMLMIASAIVTAVLVNFSPRKWELDEVLMLVVFGLATLPAIRMLAWWAVVWPWVVWPHVVATWQKLSSRQTEIAYCDKDEPTSMQTLIAVGFVFMVILISPPTFGLVAGRERGEGVILSSDTPLYVADECVRRGLEGKIATPMDWADFLVWKTNGQLKPLVHSHVHLSNPGTWHDYKTIFRGDEFWLDTLRSQQMQYVLVGRKQYPKLAKNVLIEDRTGKGGVRIIYQDQRCILAEVLPRS